MTTNSEPRSGQLNKPTKVPPPPSVYEVLGWLGATVPDEIVNKDGWSKSFTCPFCGKRWAASVCHRTNYFYCHACNIKGSGRQLKAKLEWRPEVRNIAWESEGPALMNAAEPELMCGHDIEASDGYVKGQVYVNSANAIVKEHEDDNDQAWLIDREFELSDPEIVGSNVALKTRPVQTWIEISAPSEVLTWRRTTDEQHFVANYSADESKRREFDAKRNPVCTSPERKQRIEEFKAWIKGGASPESETVSQSRMVHRDETKRRYRAKGYWDHADSTANQVVTERGPGSVRSSVSGH
jgi:hypothetical protein